eukprot:444561_1
MSSKPPFDSLWNDSEISDDSEPENKKSYKVKDAVKINECEKILREIIHSTENTETNISDDCFKQVVNYLSKFEEANDQKRAEKLQSFVSKLEQQIKQRQWVSFGFGASSNTLIEDLWIAFKECFQVDIKNFNTLYKDTSGWERENSIIDPKLKSLKFKSVENKNSIKYYKNKNNIFYEWKGYHIMTRTKKFVSDKFRLKFIDALAPLFRCCVDKTYPLKERKNDSVCKNVNDISNTHIIDGLLNNIKHKYWIPTLIKIDKDYNCKIISEILNLSILKYGNVYKYIEHIFSKMIKQFEWILKCKLNNKVIQVVIELQHYTISGNTIFKGNFHREGLKYLESIAAGGIWYLNKSKNVFKSDKLEIEANGYIVCGGSSKDSYSVDINVNDNIIFNNNIIIHRLMELNNNSNKIGKRSHILFMLPEFKIKSTYDIIKHNKISINLYQHMEYVINYIIRNTINLNNKIIPIEIKQILSSYCHTNLKKMLAFRNELRLKRVGKSGVRHNSILLASMN